MTITEDIFQHFCSTATSPIGYGLLPYVSSSIESAKGSLRTLMGEAAYKKIGELDLKTMDITDEDQRLTISAYRRVCCLAFYYAIPQLDLSLSNAGFGVTSNGNVAPASAERVERLRTQIRNIAEDALDEVVDCLRGDADWCETPVAKRWFSTLVWRGAQMRAFGYPEPHRTELIQHTSDIASAEIELKHAVSPEFFDELTASVRRVTTTASQGIIIDLCIAFIAAKVGGVKHEVWMTLRSLLGALDNNIDDFATYKASKAYEANHYQGYENDKKDPCFFFGY